jgi:hypothetical protein
LFLEQLEGRILLKLSVLADISGLSNVDNVIRTEPPDTEVAAGPTDILEVVNTHFAGFDKGSGRTVFSQDLKEFFGRPELAQLFDPVVTYYEPDSRFIVAALETDETNSKSFLDIAVSDTSSPRNADPRKDFTALARIDVTETAADGKKLWGDFTRMGWNADAIVISMNMYKFPAGELNGNFGAYDHVQLVALDKTTILNGATSTFRRFAGDVPGGNAHSTLVPAIMHDAVQGGPIWYIGNSSLQAKTGGSTVELIREANPLSTTTTFSLFSLSVAPYATPPGATQPDGKVIDTGDARIRSAASREVNGVLHLVASQNVGSGSVTHARWYDFAMGGTKPQLLQSGDVVHPGPNASTYFPALEIASNGDLGMTFLVSSSNEFMAMYLTGRTRADAPGTMQVLLQDYKGSKNYVGKNSRRRAGDYSGIAVDPDAPRTFWAANEYATTGLTPNWATGISQFTLAQLSTTTSVRSSVNPSVFGQLVSLTATVTAENSGVGPLTGTVQFQIDGNNFGDPIPVSSVGEVATVTISTASLAVGTHAVTAIYRGGGGFAGSTGSLSGGQIVNKASTRTAHTSSGNPSIFGQNVTFTATVAPMAPGAGTPTGTVQFLIDGIVFGNPMNLSAVGAMAMATINTSELAPGTHSVTAIYSGDGSFNPSHGILSGGQEVLDPAPRLIASPVSPPANAAAGYHPPVAFMPRRSDKELAEQGRIRGQGCPGACRRANGTVGEQRLGGEVDRTPGADVRDA